MTPGDRRDAARRRHPVAVATKNWSQRPSETPPSVIEIPRHRSSLHQAFTPIERPCDQPGADEGRLLRRDVEIVPLRSTPVHVLGCARHAVKEVLDGRLGHSMEQRAVEHPAECAHGWLVAATDRQMGPLRSERRHLDVRLEVGEQPLGSRRSPVHRQQSRRGKVGSHRGGPIRPADFDSRLPCRSRLRVDDEANLREQALAPIPATRRSPGIHVSGSSSSAASTSSKGAAISK